MNAAAGTATERQPITVYWHRGCSACMRTKEFLAKRGIVFESVDVVEDPSGLEELRALGALTVPVVRCGDDWVSGESWENVVTFLGLDEDTKPVLAPPALVARWRSGLDAALRTIAQFPQEKLSEPVHEGSRIALPANTDLGLAASLKDEAVIDRTCGIVAHHIFMIPRAFLNAMDEGTFRLEDLGRMPPAGANTPEAILAIAEPIVQRLDGWWQQNTSTNFSTRVPTFYGELSKHALLERCTWHSIQHTRQLISALEGFGIDPAGRLPAELFEGLPMPTDVWQ